LADISGDLTDPSEHYRNEKGEWGFSTPAHFPHAAAFPVQKQPAMGKEWN
jgi:hypothetical protein